MASTWAETKKFIRHDFYRNLERVRRGDIVKAFLFPNTTISLLLHYRICNYYATKGSRNPIQFIIHSICYLKFKKAGNKCGVELNQHTQIGYGLRLPHKGTIVIHPQAVIGNNCEIMQGVTIGNNILKNRDMVAVIGNGVMLCAGAKVIGAITIGDNVIVGANAVVNKNVDNNSIVGGVPAKYLGECDGRHIINNYEDLEK